MDILDRLLAAMRGIPYSTDPMDGPQQEASTLAALAYGNGPQRGNTLPDPQDIYNYNNAPQRGNMVPSMDELLKLYPQPEHIDPYNEAMDGSGQEASTLEAMKGFDARLHLLNREEAGPSNPMDTRVAAINREHNKNGIYAAKDSKGQAVFYNTSSPEAVPTVGGNPTTNSNRPAGSFGSSVPVAGSFQPAVSNNIRDLLNQLKQTDNPDTMRGLRSTLNESFASETAKIQNEARAFAEAKVGVPELEKMVNDNIALDRASPSYFPGRGDSDNTMQARAQLFKARGEADNEVKRYLEGNPSLAALKSAVANADVEVKRITTLADRSAAFQERQTARKEDKQFFIEQKEAQEAEGVSEDVKMNVKILNPALKDADDISIFKNIKQAKTSNNKKYLEAVSSPDAALPRYAVDGNEYAKAILMEKESKLGINPINTQAQLSQLTELVRSPTKLKKSLVEMSMLSGIPKQDAEKLFSDIDTKSAIASNPEEKEAAANARFQLARRIVTAQMTSTYMNDVTAWGSADPELQAAITKAKSITGKSGIEDVTVAMTQGQIGPQARMAVDKLISLVTEAARKSEGSAFGMIDYHTVANRIRASVLPSFMQRLKDNPFSLG